MTTTSKRCEATKRNGQPCTAWAGEGSAYCFWHDPAKARARKAARSSGGKARHGRQIGPSGPSEPVTLASVSDILKIVENAINDCLSLEISLQRARTIGYLAGMAIKSFEVSELEQRIARLEEVVNERKP